MAHEINEHDHMVSVKGVVPWHGLGTVVDAEALSHAEALKLAKLDWTVEQEDIYDADMAQVEGYKINRRSDTRQVIGLVSPTWEPIQNSMLLEIAEALAQVDSEELEFKPVIETAGSLRNGAIVWALVQIGLRKFADSDHRSYLLLSNGHDGKRAMRGTLTDVRVVCNNTLTAAERAQASLMVNHKAGVIPRMEAAIETIGWANEATHTTFQLYNALRETKVNFKEVIKGFKHVLKAEETAKQKANATDDFDNLPADGDATSLTSRTQTALSNLADIYITGPGINGDTAFDFLMAVTDYADHHRPVHTSRYTENERREKNFLDSTFSGGSGVLLKQRAKKYAMAMAGM